MMENGFDTYWRVDKVSRVLNVSNQYVYKLIKDGKFPSARRASSDGFVGNPGWEIKVRDVQAILAEREEKKNQPKERKAKSKDSETIELLKELYATMEKQTEILGKLIERMA